MAAPFTQVKRKTEDAIEALINALKGSELAGVTLYKGISMTELVTPRIEIVAERAEVERYGETITGNFTVTVSTALVSHKNDVTRGTHATRCGAVEDIIMRDDVEEMINDTLSIVDFKAFSPGWYPVDSTDLTNGSELKTMYTATLYCRPSTPYGDAG